VPQSRRRDRDGDRHGFDGTRDHLGAAVARLLPTALVRRAIAISVSTDRESYAPGDPVRVRVAIRNRLPVPVSVGTSTRRRWGWEVDGLLEASDEPRLGPGGDGELTFRARERKRFAWTWDGRVKRVREDGVRSLPLDRGDHEIRAFVGTPAERPAAATTIRIE